MFSSESSTNESSAQTSNATCKFFNANKGHCRYGERCRFVHQFNYDDLNRPKNRTPDAKKSRSQEIRGYSGNPTRRHQQGDPEQNRTKSWRSKPQPKRSNNAGLNLQTLDEALLSNSGESQQSFENQTTRQQHPKTGILDKDGKFEGLNIASAVFLQDHEDGFVDVTHSSADIKIHESPNREYEKGRARSRVCRYAVRGFCKKGEHCQFSHHHPGPSTAPKVCQYFQRGYCRKGDRCHFAHTTRPGSNALPNDLNRRQPDIESNGSEEDNEFVLDDHLQAGEKRECNRYVVPVGNSNSDSEKSDFPKANSDCLTTVDVTDCSSLITAELGNFDIAENGFRSKEQLRDIEITMLQKRISKEDLQQLDEQSFVVTVAATDPDWPYDIRHVKIMIRFELSYPDEPPFAEVREKDNDALPPNLISHLSRNVRGWFDRQHKLNTESGLATLMFRPFLRWFDRNVEAMFTEGLRKTKRELEAKAAGLEFVPFECLPGSMTCESAPKPTLPPVESGEQRGSNSVDDLAILKQSTIEATVKLESPLSEIKGAVPLNMDDLRSTNKGTAIKLCNLRLGENVAAITCQKLAATVQCTRCKCSNDVRVAPRRRNLLKCGQCAISQYVTFRPSMVHAFDATLGYLDLDDCKAFDLILVECIFSVQCLECMKQHSTDGIHYGQPWFTWCHNCNTKLEMYIGSPKFLILQPNKIRNKGPVDQIKSQSIKRIKNPSIQEGKPLPDCGTCKHYKKSYRWFRFPCCGKAYACDLCHNEKELEHEMKLANRVICGFCAKEQPYTGNKPCLGCTLSMTNINRGHWEGGKGCRDKIRMSRDDKQKYVGVTKTVPKKVSDQKEKNK